MNDLLVTREEAARLLKVSLSTFDKLHLPCVRLLPKGRKLYDPEDLKAYIDRCKQ